MVKKQTCCNTAGRKRGVIAVGLGLLLGLFSAYVSYRRGLLLWMGWSEALFWACIFNRTLIGVGVWLGGWLMQHPFFSPKHLAWWRGMEIGGLVSIGLGIFMFSLSKNHGWENFWLIVLSGSLYGMLIDLVATRYAGEGKTLIK